MDEELVNENTKATKTLSSGFMPTLKGKKVVIRLVSGGQPITGTVEGYTPYEILIQTTKDNSWSSSTP
jgi:hypothetical protein